MKLGWIVFLNPTIPPTTTWWWFSRSYLFIGGYWWSIQESWHNEKYICFNLIYFFTFICHDRHFHTCPLQAPESLPLSTVLPVTEVEAWDKDAQPQVGHLSHEARKAIGAIWTGWPGTEPRDGVCHPDTLHTGAQETWAQYPKIAQEEKLRGGKQVIRMLFLVINICIQVISLISNTSRILIDKSPNPCNGRCLVRAQVWVQSCDGHTVFISN